MQTTVESIDPITVKLTVEIEPERVSAAFDQAVEELSERVDIPGFRKGKAPRRLLEQQLGEGVVQQQAVENSLTDFYVEAVHEEDLAPVARPEVDLDYFDEDDGCRFEVTVQVRPDFEAPGHEGINVTHPDWEVTGEDVDEHLRKMQDQFAEVETVDRPAEEGDYVTLDLIAEVDGEPLEDSRVEDAMYEVGSGGVTEQFDEQITGREAGEDFTFTDTLPDEYPEHGGREAELSVSVKDVRHKEVPELDDDFAVSASEYDTIEELRDDIRDSLLRQSIQQARQQLRDRVAEAYVANVDIPLPDAMVDNEVEAREAQLETRAERYGVSVEELLEMEGSDRESFDEDIREQARDSVKSRLVLDQLAQELDVEVTEEDITEEINYHARQQQVEPEELARVLEEQGSIGALAGDILRRKAIDALLGAAEIEAGPDNDLLVELGLAEDEEEAEESGLIVPGRTPQASAGASELIVP